MLVITPRGHCLEVLVSMTEDQQTIIQTHNHCPNFPDLTGRNNNATPTNAGITVIGGLAPLTMSTPNQNANVTNTHSNLQPGRPHVRPVK